MDKCIGGPPTAADYAAHEVARLRKENESLRGTIALMENEISQLREDFAAIKSALVRERKRRRG